MRKLLESFTATHITIMFGIAVLAPSALYAIPSYTNVAIENVTTGVRAAVDSTGHLLINDSIGNYANNPNNFARSAMATPLVARSRTRSVMPITSTAGSSF